MANWMRFRWLQRLMVWGVYLVVPRHQIGINMVALDDQGRVLLLKHVFHPTAPWGLPGGWLGRREDPKQCVLRELREETGLTAVPGPVLLTEYNDRPPHISIIFLAHVEPGPVTLSSEILEVRWFSPDALPYPLMPVTYRVIDTAVAYQDSLRQE